MLINIKGVNEVLSEQPLCSAIDDHHILTNYVRDTVLQKEFFNISKSMTKMNNDKMNNDKTQIQSLNQILDTNNFFEQILIMEEERYYQSMNESY